MQVGGPYHQPQVEPYLKPKKKDPNKTGASFVVLGKWGVEMGRFLLVTSNASNIFELAI